MREVSGVRDEEGEDGVGIWIVVGDEFIDWVLRLLALTLVSDKVEVMGIGVGVGIDVFVIVLVSTNRKVG